MAEFYSLQMKDLRYDRQVRLWGDDGQSAIETTTVCLLGSSALATEILKSLVLAGIDSFCIIDDAVVEQPDLGTNFFMEESDIGKPRAEAAVRLLKELNCRVSGSFICRPSRSLNSSHLEQLVPFSVVVAVNFCESEATPISSFLFDRGIPFISTRVYGFLGALKICVKEHPIVNTHQENVPPDLRIDRPFPALKELIESTDLSTMTDEQVRHTPYLVLYAMALKNYKKSSDPNAFPDTFAKRKAFLPFIMELAREKEQGGTDENFDQAKTSLARSLLVSKIPSKVNDLLADPKCSEEIRGAGEPFWVMCTALRRFVERNGLLPLAGQLPDMASDSASYARLASIYHEKAMQDVIEVLEDVRSIEEESCANEDQNMNEGDTVKDLDCKMEEDRRSLTALHSSPIPSRRTDGIAFGPISKEACTRFCKNAALLDMQRGTSIGGEGALQAFKEAVVTPLSYLEEEDFVEGVASPTIWLLLLKAVDRFRDEKGRFPGTNGIPCDIDSFDVKNRVINIVKECMQESEDSMEGEGPSVDTVVKNVAKTGAIDEICRYAASEVHGVAALMGGIAAQEVIKLATRQYIPVHNTLIYDAHSANTATFLL